MGRDFVEWFKRTGLGFVTEQQVPSDVMPSLMDYLKNTNKVGVYVYHSHSKVNGEPQFDGMRLGYYVRSKNPFKWNFRSTAGNE